MARVVMWVGRLQYLRHTSPADGARYARGKPHLLPLPFLSLSPSKKSSFSAVPRANISFPLSTRHPILFPSIIAHRRRMQFSAFFVQQPLCASVCAALRSKEGKGGRWGGRVVGALVTQGYHGAVPLTRFHDLPAGHAWPLSFVRSWKGAYRESSSASPPSDVKI